MTFSSNRICSGSHCLPSTCFLEWTNIGTLRCAMQMFAKYLTHKARACKGHAQAQTACLRHAACHGPALRHYIARCKALPNIRRMKKHKRALDVLRHTLPEHVQGVYVQETCVLACIGNTCSGTRCLPFRHLRDIECVGHGFCDEHQMHTHALPAFCSSRLLPSLGKCDMIY